MKRWNQWIAPVAALVLMAGLQTNQTRANDDMTANGKATVTVTVVDADGKPVEGADVSLLPPPVKKEKGVKGGPSTQPDAIAMRPRPTPIETGTTAADGTFALTKVPDGSFVVTARFRGKGTGRAKVTVMDDKDETVSVTLKARKPRATTNG